MFLTFLLRVSDVEKLMRPLLSRDLGSCKRGYPSGGALYPVESSRLEVIVPFP